MFIRITCLNSTLEELTGYRPKSQIIAKLAYRLDTPFLLCTLILHNPLTKIVLAGVHN